MKLPRTRFLVLMACLLVLLTVLGIGASIWIVRSEHDPPGEGSDSEAERMESELREIIRIGKVPATDQSSARESRILLDMNDGWIVVQGTNSHGAILKAAGGTVAVLGSNGRFQVYYGHVCGGGSPALNAGHGTTVDSYLDSLASYSEWSLIREDVIPVPPALATTTKRANRVEMSD